MTAAGRALLATPYTPSVAFATAPHPIEAEILSPPKSFLHGSLAGNAVSVTSKSGRTVLAI